MAADTEFTGLEEKQLLSKRETVTWKPRKEYLLKNIPDVMDRKSEESEFSDTFRNEDDVSDSAVDSVHSYSDLEDLDDEDFSGPDAVTFPELQTAAVYETEDWDKDLEESHCSPYDADDFYCGSFQKNNLLASYAWQEDSFYNPSCHHAACIASVPPVRTTEIGQFDDADE